MNLAKLLTSLRDQVIHRSQLGKQKLDLAFTRRELDDRLRLLGERYRQLVREGRAGVPEDLEDLVAAVKRLERRLEEQESEVARLRQEATGET